MFGKGSPRGKVKPIIGSRGLFYIVVWISFCRISDLNVFHIIFGRHVFSQKVWFECIFAEYLIYMYSCRIFYLIVFLQANWQRRGTMCPLL